MGDLWALKVCKGASGPIPLVSPIVPGTMLLYSIVSLCNAVVMG